MWHLHQSRSAWVSSGGWSKWCWRPASHTGCLCSPSSSPLGWSPELYLRTAVKGYHLNHYHMALFSVCIIIKTVQNCCHWVDRWVAVFCSGPCMCNVLSCETNKDRILNAGWPIYYAVKGTSSQNTSKDTKVVSYCWLRGEGSPRPCW